MKNPVGRAWCVTGFLIVLAFGCKRTDESASTAAGSSLMFNTGSPEAREALATPVNFILNEDNFAKWQDAQRYLEALPRSAVPSEGGSGRTAVDRAVSRLESSPRARTAIERTGLSVRDFVLETIALAQAAEATETGKSTSNTPIPPANFQFVQRYRARVLLARRAAAMASDRANNYESGVEPPAVESGQNADADASDSAHDGMRNTDDTTKHRGAISDSARDTLPPPER
jgi:hypothetical protein